MPPENQKTGWTDPRFLLTLLLLIGGGGSSFGISSYRISELEKDLEKIESYNLAVIQQDVKTTKSLVKQIAEKMGIVVADL